MVWRSFVFKEPDKGHLKRPMRHEKRRSYLVNLINRTDSCELRQKRWFRHRCIQILISVCEDRAFLYTLSCTHTLSYTSDLRVLLRKCFATTHVTVHLQMAAVYVSIRQHTSAYGPPLGQPVVSLMSEEFMKLLFQPGCYWGKGEIENLGVTEVSASGKIWIWVRDNFCLNDGSSAMKIMFQFWELLGVKGEIALNT